MNISALSTLLVLCALFFSTHAISFYSYKYATAERFSSPKAIPFTKNDSLSSFPPACYQPEFPGVISYNDMSEDCLYASVWVPNHAETEKLPVIVFIHGGAFVNGAASYYNASYFASQGNVIVVTLQYRLGMLGFMALEALESEHGVGNLGILDQLEGLRWVKRHLGELGGDTERITIMGESAGGISVQIHQAIAAQHREDLFHRAITMSGVFNFNATKPLVEARAIAQRNVHALNCDSSEPRNVVQCLKSVDPRVVVQKTTPPPSVFDIQPTVDGVLLKKTINQYYKDGDFLPLPNIIGSTATEFSTEICLKHDGKMDYTTLIKSLEKDFPSMVNSILSTYNLTAGQKSNYIHDFVRISADAVVHCPTRRTTASIAQRVPDNTYFYTFGHAYGFIYECMGAAHAMDLISLFPESFLRAIGVPTYQLTEEEKILSENVIQFFSNFAASGNVNSRRSDILALHRHHRKPLQCFYWAPYTPDTDMDMYFDTSEKMDRRKHFYEQVCALWDGVERRV